MKILRPIYFIYTFCFVFFLLNNSTIKAQFDSVEARAFYPLITNSHDTLGNYDSMIMTEAVFDRGLYSTGTRYLPAYTKNGSKALAGIKNFDFNSFKIALKFKAHSYQDAPIIMGGPVYRWIGAYLRPDSTLGLKYNNSSIASSTVKYDLHKWHEIVITYDSIEGKLFYDGVEVINQPFSIVHTGDASLLTEDQSRGRVFKGVWQNLRVYNNHHGDSLIAHYPLIYDGLDITGKSFNMHLTNTTFLGGVYNNGVYIYNGDGLYGSLVQTPEIDSLDFNNFEVSFKFQSGNIQHGPVLTGGDSYRWMGLHLNNDTTVSLFYNNSTYFKTNAKYSPGDWHKVHMSYNGTVGKLYFDEELVAEEIFTLTHGDDRNFSTSNFGSGKTFRGTIQDLKLYDADTAGNIIAHYPLLTDAVDATGNYGDIELNNAFFVGGACSDGRYLTSQIATPTLDSLDFDRFAISGRFKTPVAIKQPVIIGGNLGRWLGIYLQPDSSIGIKYNNSNYLNCGVKYTPNEWHHFILSYDRDSQKAWVYIDSMKTCEVNFDLVDFNDRNFSVSDFAGGRTFEGCIQDITIYEKIAVADTGSGTSVEHFLNPASLKIYPNPTSSVLNIEVDEEYIYQTQLSIYNLQGQLIFKQPVNQTLKKMDISHLVSGAYIVMITHKDGRRISRRLIKH